MWEVCPTKTLHRCSGISLTHPAPWLLLSLQHSLNLTHLPLQTTQTRSLSMARVIVPSWSIWCSWLFGNLLTLESLNSQQDKKASPDNHSEKDINKMLRVLFQRKAAIVTQISRKLSGQRKNAVTKYFNTHPLILHFEEQHFLKWGKSVKEAQTFIIWHLQYHLSVA